MHAADDRAAEHQELRFSCGRVAGVEQVALGGVAHRPVDVLARAVDAGERLLVQQADNAVLLAVSFRIVIVQLLVVGGDVGGLEEGAISNWPGATSLWWVLAGMPSSYSSSSTSCMKTWTRSGMAPK